MRATVKLVNAINNGSIAAFLVRDGTKTPAWTAQNLQFNALGGTLSEYTIDPVTLSVSTGIKVTDNTGNGFAYLVVTAPGWIGAKQPNIVLDFSLNVTTLVPPFTSDAVTGMAAAGYFA